MSDESRVIAETRALIARLGALMYERRLTDAAGGNISARVGDVVCMSPRYAGSQHLWALQPDDVLVVDLDGNILEGTGQISREAKVHLHLHRSFGDAGTGVIHAHARNALVFAALGRAMPPVLEANRKFGEVPVIAFAPSHSQALADRVVAAIRPQTAKIGKQAAAVIAPYHGLFVMGKDVKAAYDAVERLDNNAYILIMAQMLGGSPMLTDERAALEKAVAEFSE